MILSKYLKAFIIGSSMPAFIGFFIAYYAINNKMKQLSYVNYTIIAPLYIGVMNMLSVYLADKYNLSLRKRLLYISIISPLIVIIIATIMKAYNFETNIEWLHYYLKIFAKHFITYNIIIYLLEKNIN